MYACACDRGVGKLVGWVVAISNKSGWVVEDQDRQELL